MVETQLLAEQDTEAMVNEVKRRKAENPWLVRVPAEHIVTYELLDKHPLVMQQQAWSLHWNEVDALYQFPSSIPGFIVDMDIFATWHSEASALERVQPFVGHDSQNLLSCQALFLTLAPLRPMEAADGCGPGLPQGGPKDFVFSAMTVFVHPQHKLLPIAAGIDALFPCHGLVIEEPHLPGWGILCQLPQYWEVAFFPCLGYANYLVLPIEAMADKTTPLILRLDQADLALQSFVVRKLHQHQRIDGTVTILPPTCGVDPSLPAEYLVEERAKLWANKQHMTLVAPGGTTKERATLNGITTCPLEADVGECKVLLTEATFIRYASTEEGVPNEQLDEPAAPLTDEKQDEAVEPPDNRPDEAAKVTPTVPVPEEVDNPVDEEAKPADSGDKPDGEGDKSDDNPEGGVPGSPVRMEIQDDAATHGVGSAVEDSDSDDDLVMVPDADSEEEAIERHRTVVLSGEEMLMSSDSDSEDGDALTRDQLLIVNEKLEKSEQRGSGWGKASAKRDRQHDSGCRETSDSGTTNIGPILEDGQTWSIPHYQARPLDRTAYMNTLEELADEQMIAAT